MTADKENGTWTKVLLIGMWVVLTVIVVPMLAVVFEHVKSLESRTAWICEERSQVIQLSNLEGGTTPLKVLPPGCNGDRK